MKPLRIAIIATPRSGNTWTRSLLTEAYGLKFLSVHNPSDIAWDDLPPRFVLQMHWRKTAPFLSQLTKNDFKIVVLSRHPLDVLISILHFAPHEAATARWLEGEGGNESSILGASPTSPAFLEYATSSRAAALLNVSREWVRGCRWFRYEDMVRDPVDALTRMGRSLSQPLAPGTIEQAIAATTMEKQRPTAGNQHYWRGQPGHWRSLLPAAEAHHIAAAHSAVFKEFGYECDPDEGLDAAQAEANWEAIR